ncbi:MAG: hypothetical protein OXU64_07535 [Gemmatimonadota bacterium]|nr:hypothetical protein [Gemmatimonadota bacterium]
MRGVGRVVGDAGGDLECGKCGRACRARELDRLLWCEACIAGAKATAKRVGWLCGAVIAAGLAAWIHFVQKPSAALMGGWVGVVLAALWLCARAATELCYGVLRILRRPGSS